MKRLLVALGLFSLLGSCIFIDDDHCRELAVTCDGDLVMECFDDSWEVIEDCWALCGGTCAYHANQGPVCLCEDA